MQEIILASQSPRRKQLLEWAEIPFRVEAIPTDEQPEAGLSTEEIAIRIAEEKARPIVKKNPGKTVIAADTIVVMNGKILGKPQNRVEAIEMLTALSGNSHQVITGVVITDGVKEEKFAELTHVEFHPLSVAQIEYYVDQYQPYDKAGAYAIQEWIGVVGIRAIKGDFYNVVGLPVSRVVRTLQCW